MRAQMEVRVDGAGTMHNARVAAQTRGRCVTARAGPFDGVPGQAATEPEVRFFAGTAPARNFTRRCARCGRVRSHHHGAQGPWPWTVPLPEPITTREIARWPLPDRRHCLSLAMPPCGLQRRQAPSALHAASQPPTSKASGPMSPSAIHPAAMLRLPRFVQRHPAPSHVRAGESGRAPSRHRLLHTVPSLPGSRRCASRSTLANRCPTGRMPNPEIET